MTQQIINIGAGPNDGTGDPARNAFDKCNVNFTELYQVSRPTGNAIEFQFNNTVTEPPSVGQIRFNQATQASTTKLWASHTTSSGINIKQFLAAATTGAKLVLQDKIDNTNYIKFDVTGAPVDKTTYWEFTVAVTASGGNLPSAAILAAVTASAGVSVTDVIPQCGRLTYVSATALKFAPLNGDRIKIGGSIFAIPSAGIAGLANTSVFVNGTAGQNLAANTTYLVCAFSNAGTITADFRSTLTHAPSATAGNVGVEIPTGLDTRTVIGMVRTAGTNFVSTAQQKYTISWFNRCAISSVGVRTNLASTTSTSSVEIGSSFRAEFVTWAEETVTCGLWGYMRNNNAATVGANVGIDGASTTVFSTPILYDCINAGAWAPVGGQSAADLTEGYHYLTPTGSVASGTGLFDVACTAVVRG